MPMNREIREIELRALEQEGSNEMILEGYACVFNQETMIGAPEWGWREIIDTSAFDGADLKDVPLKYNHGDGVPILARTRNGSLQLMVDDHGLKIRASLLDTQDSRDIYKRVQAGLLDKMSFAFTIAESDWFEGDGGDVPLRKIKRFKKIYDVSIVDVPAYDGTEINARSREEAGCPFVEKVEERRIDADLAALMVRYGV